MKHKTIAKTYGIPVSYKYSPATHLNWDGKKINAKNLKEDAILHELAHWVIAPDKYKEYPEYYLGVGPDANGKIYAEKLRKKLKTLHMETQSLSRKNSEVEETETCVLEFIFAALTTKTNRKSLRLLSDRNFIYQSGYSSTKLLEEPIQKYIQSLQRKKILDKDWAPIKLKSKMLPCHRKNLLRFKKLVEGLVY
jgi:hypothetical protein